MGLDTHEDVMCQAGCDLVGLCISPAGRVTVSPKRRWRLHLAIGELLARSRCRGGVVEVLLGHFTFQALLRRETLSVFRAAYTFARRYRERSMRLWPAVCREMRWARSLLMCMEVDLTKSWSPCVYAVDASEWGAGICRAGLGDEVASRLGAFSERWRFKKGDPPVRYLARASIVSAVLQSSPIEKAEETLARIERREVRGGITSERLLREIEALRGLQDPTHAIPLPAYNDLMAAHNGWKTTTSAPGVGENTSQC